MKHIKLFMFVLAATLMAACSNDEDFNSLGTTVGFEKDTLLTKESVGLIKIPLVIEGYRNGLVSVEVSVKGTGANPAVEGKNFRITDKSLSLYSKNDTTSSSVLNLELETIDDTEINENRELTLSIAASNGAKVIKKDLVVVLRDNDAAFYEKMFGKWTLTAVDDEDNPVEKTIIISGAFEESDPDYDHILWISAPSLFDVGVPLNCEWPMEYSYDKETKTGTLSHLMNQNIVASYAGAYEWIFLTDDGENYSEAPVATEWSLGEGDTFPTEFSWGEQTVWLYQPDAGWWAYLTNIKITKQ